MSERPTDLLSDLQALINALLRFGIAGGSAVLAYAALRQDHFAFLSLGTAATDVSWVLLLFVVAVVGPALYALHRAVLYPPIVFILQWILIRKHGLKGISPSMLRRDIDRFKLTSRRKISSRRPDLEAAASQVHFLFCSAWGCAAAISLALSLHRIQGGTKLELVPLLLVLAGLLLVSACARDLQVMSTELQAAYEKSPS
jgi:hypothetical protein